MQTGTLLTSISLILASGLLVLAGVFADARPVFAQTSDCPRPAGVAIDPLATPAVRADSGDVKGLALAARAYRSILTNHLERSYFYCLMREDNGVWRAGDTYLIFLLSEDVSGSPGWRVSVHAEDMSLGGRLLNPAATEAILQAAGEVDSDGGRVSGGGHAVWYKTPLSPIPGILLAGVDIQESDLVREPYEPTIIPDVTARDVADRQTLKQFVNGAIAEMVEIYAEEDIITEAKIRRVFRDPDGPWRHGSIYVFMMDDTGYTTVHGAFPDKYEFQKPTDTLRDAVTGKLILPQIIEVAKSSPEGGFVEYYFDDPNDATDSADVPKVTFARAYEFEVDWGGRLVKFERIVGAGFYGSSGGVAAPVGRLENPGPASFQSGISALWGWVCEAEFVEVEIETAQGQVVEYTADYGMERLDTQDTCGDTDNGFVLLLNWNLLGAGAHTVTAVVDGVALGRATVQVTPLGEGDQQEFLRGVVGECVAEDFPYQGQSTRLDWQQNSQNFVITEVQ